MTILLTLLIIATCIRPSVAAIMFTVVTVGFSVLWDGLDGMLYYPAAALADFTVIILLSFFTVTPIIIRLFWLSILSVLFNAGGWLLWWAYMPPTVYNWCFGLLYTVAITVILLRNDTDGLRFIRLCIYRFNLHRNNMSRVADGTKGGR